MASVKVKFRPSTIEGKEGTIYYQIIQNREAVSKYFEMAFFVSTKKNRASPNFTKSELARFPNFLYLRESN